VKDTFGVDLNRKGFVTPKQWLFDFLAKCSSQQATTLAVTFWHLWDTRNKLREEGGTVHPTTVAMKIKAYVDMIITHLYKPDANQRRESSLAVPWTPPPVGTLIVNVDAALFEASISMGSGVVIRDHMGNSVQLAVTVFQMFRCLS
jgi:hypothetical protein